MTVHEDFHVSIPSDTDAGLAVQDRIISALERLDFGPRDVFGVRLALEEALVNAIKHGNGMDPNKSVKIACQITDSQVSVEIEDEGPGFDVTDVPDPTEEENLERPCGRGIMLMRAFMTTIEYNSSGNRVLLVKRKSVEGEEDAAA